MFKTAIVASFPNFGIKGSGMESSGLLQVHFKQQQQHMSLSDQSDLGIQYDHALSTIHHMKVFSK